MNSLIKEQINKHIQKFQEIEDYEDFYFQKAVEALKNWIDFSISNDELNRIISTKYEDFLNDSSLTEQPHHCSCRDKTKCVGSATLQIQT